MNFIAPLFVGPLLKKGIKALSKKPSAQPQVRTITRNAAAEALQPADELARRRGFASTLVTGSAGAEALMGSAYSPMGR